MQGEPPVVALDDAQRAVVHLATEASGVAIGSPGSGKTEALVARVAHLLGEGGLSADELVVLTPTRQTATALRDRLAVLASGVTAGPLARSVASFSYQLVRAAMVQAGEQPPQLLTAGDQDRILSELLAGDEEDAAAGNLRWPEPVGPAVRASRGFRTELRSLFAECTERGVEPRELAALGRATGREVWTAAAQFLEDYRFAVGGMRAAHRDAAELVREAAGLLASAPLGAEGAAVIGAPARLRVVLVDDAQELTLGGITLLRALRSRGVAVFAFGDPDISSGAFRGASPALFAELCDILEEVHVLSGPHRSAPPLAQVVRTITAAIGASGRIEHRRPPGAPIEPGESVRTILAPSPFEEVDRIARVLREWHLLGEIPWGSMAVIAHDTRSVAALEVELAAREVPTRAAGVTRPLGSERVVRELLGIVRLGVCEPADRDADALSEALLSPFGGLDAVGLRRLRARLRHAELEAGGTRSARELLVEAMEHPAGLLLVPAPEARTAERLATTLHRLYAERERGANVHELMWLVWDGARDGHGVRLQKAWKQLATSPGSLSSEVGHALDVLVALFDAAKRFVERSPHEAPEPFLRRILDSAVPEDTLTSPERPDVVAVLTPAAALGAQYDAVVIAGLQDGVWPNVRLRGSLLDEWRLADDLAAWREGRPSEVPAVLDRRRAALHDELRLLVRAVSRARSRVAVTAVDDDDFGPSPFLAFFPEPDDTAAVDAEAGHPLTLRGLVAQHRRTLTTARTTPSLRHAAGQLALLADAGVVGAATVDWFGIAAPTSTAPLRDPERAPVPISPSKLKQFAECPLDWAIRALGGDTRSWSAGAGVILHAAMEDVPSGEREELRRVVDERWGELDFEAPWLSRKEHVWAHLLADRLHTYLHRFHAEGGRTIGAEARFRLAVEMDAAEAAVPRVHVIDPDAERATGPFAMLSGSIDRVEVYPNGHGEDVPAEPERADAERVLIVDLKTGRSETRVSDDKVSDDPQLAAYQLAFLEGLVPGADPADNAGARLIVLSKNTIKQPNYRLARQAAMDEQARAMFLASIVETAWGMSSAHFDAPIDAHCSTSRFGVCALHTVRAVSAS